MVKYEQQALNAVFSALSDPTRRGILAALCERSMPVSELAEPFDMSLPGFTKHLQILEDAGLLRREKAGRVVNCILAADPLQSAAEWLARYQAFWTSRLDALAEFLDKEESPWPTTTNAHHSRSSENTKHRRKKSGARGPLRKR